MLSTLDAITNNAILFNPTSSRHALLKSFLLDTAKLSPWFVEPDVLEKQILVRMFRAPADSAVFFVCELAPRVWASQNRQQTTTFRVSSRLGAVGSRFSSRLAL